MVSALIVSLLFVAAFLAIVLPLGWLDMGRVTRAQHLIAAGSPYIDVDPPEQYALAHPHGSVSMPYPHTVDLARNLDRSVTLVIHGHFFRAALATHRLRKAGFRVLSLGSARVEGI